MPSLYSSKTSTGWQLRADYSTSQEIANNRTLFSVDLYVYAGTSGSYNSNTSASLSAYYTIYGEQKYQPYNFSTTGWKYLGSRSFYIPHNADGTKTFTFTADWHSRNATSYTPASVSISTSITLPTIPRASSISAGSFTIGSSGNITINRASSSFTHKLTYSFGSASGTIGTGLGTSATWTPPNSLLSQVPTQTSKTCTITCTTYSGGTAIGTYSINVTLYVASEVVPSISESTISPVNENSWINEKGLYVGGFTKARIQTKATAGQGASIKSITINGTSASDDWTSPILTAGQKSFIIRVTDTRGRYVEKNVSALFLEYTQPLFVTAKAVRSDALGLEIDDGTYLYAIGEVTHSSLDGNNQVQLKLCIRTSGGEWQQFVNIENNVAYIQEGLLLTASYEVEIVATDLVGSNATRLFKIATASIDFHLRHGGRGAAFGKYSETEGLEVDWDSKFYKDVEVDGTSTFNGEVTVGGDFRVNGGGRFDQNINTANGIESSDIGNGDYIAFPQGGTYRGGSYSEVGWLKITLPVSWTDTMLSFKISLYNYDQQQIMTEYTISGYNYEPDGRWYHPSAYCEGNGPYANLPVGFCHDGEKCCIAIGYATTSWCYLQAHIHDVTLGYSGKDYELWSKGWDIEITTSNIAQCDMTIYNTGQISRNVTPSAWYNGRDNALVKTKDTSGGSFFPITSIKTERGSWEIGTVREDLYIVYVLDEDYNGSINQVRSQYKFSANVGPKYL